MTARPGVSGTALVTGAGDRIGATIAKRLAAAGHGVVVHYRANEAGARKVVDAITQAGGQAAMVRANLGDRADRAGLVAAASAPFGPLTALINNASTFRPDSARDLDEALWDAHFAAHLEAPAFLSRDFAAQLPDGEKGNIINVIDERVLHLSPAYFSYSLSKAALWQATRLLAQSLAPSIRVNAVAPGMTLPPPGQSPEAWDATEQSLPLGRGTSPDEVADAILFLLNSPAITGQMIALDGGEHLEWRASRGPTPRQP